MDDQEMEAESPDRQSQPVFGIAHSVASGVKNLSTRCTSEANADPVDTIPTAWMRRHTTPGSMNGPAEHDVDLAYGDEQPDGDGWEPLYRKPGSLLTGQPERDAPADSPDKIRVARSAWVVFEADGEPILAGIRSTREAAIEATCFALGYAPSAWPIALKKGFRCQEISLCSRNGSSEVAYRPISDLPDLPGRHIVLWNGRTEPVLDRLYMGDAEKWKASGFATHFALLDVGPALSPVSGSDDFSTDSSSSWLRSEASYAAIISDPGGTDALLKLDEDRRRAQEVLGQPKNGYSVSNDITDAAADFDIDEAVANEHLPTEDGLW